LKDKSFGRKERMSLAWEEKLHPVPETCLREINNLQEKMSQLTDLEGSALELERKSITQIERKGKYQEYRSILHIEISDSEDGLKI